MPKSQSSLLELEGVGPKIAHLVLSVGLGVARTGIVVDTHVHRCVCVRVCERERVSVRGRDRQRERADGQEGGREGGRESGRGREGRRLGGREGE